MINFNLTSGIKSHCLPFWHHATPIPKIHPFFSHLPHATFYTNNPYHSRNSMDDTTLRLSPSPLYHQNLPENHPATGEVISASRPIKNEDLSSFKALRIWFGFISLILYNLVVWLCVCSSLFRVFLTHLGHCFLINTLLTCIILVLWWYHKTWLNEIGLHFT